MRYDFFVELGPGSIVGDYEILAFLGRGAMGTVYKVRNSISDRIEAMKVLRPEATNAEIASRFAREIKLVACLEHPNIAQLRTAMRVQDQLVMVMEYVEGAALDVRMRRGRIEWRHSLDYTMQVLSALDYAHQQGVVHRDVKPQNILLTSRDTVKLTDFGIASKMGDPRQTAAGTALGSLYYMSPEQVRAERPDGRSDIYSVGVTLYELVTGERPIQAASQFALLQAHLQQVPRPPIELRADLHPELSRIIMKSVQKDPAARFQTAEEFRRALEALRAVTAPFEHLRHPASFTGPHSHPVPAPPASPYTPQSEIPTSYRPAPSSFQPSPPSPSSGSISLREWDPALIDRLRKELATYIGPLAKIIVSRAAKKAKSVDELYDLVAAEITTEGDRRKFMATFPH